MDNCAQCWVSGRRSPDARLIPRPVTAGSDSYGRWVSGGVPPACEPIGQLQYLHKADLTSAAIARSRLEPAACTHAHTRAGRGCRLRIEPFGLVSGLPVTLPSPVASAE